MRSLRAYLSTVVTRFSIDQLRSAQVWREDYVGPWLPEPLIGESSAIDVADEAMLDESLSMAFLVLLESLTPTERAVFLLREVFDYDYSEISRLVGKSEANCRQIAHRAREYVAARRPRFAGSREQQELLAERFIEAVTGGDMEALLTLLVDGITLWSDGGGKIRAALNPIHGPEKVARFLLGVVRKTPPGFTTRTARINGQSGIVGYVEGQPTTALTLDVWGEGIRNIHVVVNPEKLRAMPPLS